MDNKRVLVLGASTNPNRYSYLATEMLLNYKFTPILVGNKPGNIQGIEIQKQWPLQPVDTITVYIGAANQKEVWQQLKPGFCKRVIFNPGAENVAIYGWLKQQNIEVEEACTLVLLRTGQF